MVQILYSIAAIMLLGITVLNINVKIHGTQDRMMFNELALEMTGVGTEVLNEIGKYPFDPGTISGLVVAADSLSLAADFGTGACNPDDPDYSGCSTISDFHLKTASRTRERIHSGTPYTITYNVTEMEVRYVSETPPHVASGTPTFAKEVTLNVSTPALVNADGGPFEITMSRVYMYPNL